LEGVLDVRRQDVGSGVSLFTLECRPGASGIREQVASVVVRNNWGLLGLQSVKMTLEDIFLKLTAREQEGPRS
jgi:hypothetical protein